MPTPFSGFCGPSYQYENKYAAVERCVNLMPVANEYPREEKKFDLAMNECPGNAPFGNPTIPNAPFNVASRGMIAHSFYGLFIVNGVNLIHVNSGGIYDHFWPLTGDPSGTGPVGMQINGNSQLFISHEVSGIAWVLNMSSSTLTAVTPGTYLCNNQIAFQDGYILGVRVDGVGSTNFLQISGDAATPVGDSLIWDPSNISVQEGQNDGLQAIISSREYVRIFGAERSQVYYNAGANGLGGFPFQSYNETFIETGISSARSLCDLGDSLAWMGRDKRGIRAAWQDFGFQPQRISTFAIEQIWQTYNYNSVQFAQAFAYTWKGHTLWQITFSNPNPATWVYDATMSKLLGKPIWFERNYVSASDGSVTRRPEIYHAFCYGLHLVASDGTDGNPGAVYQYADTYCDVGSPNGTEAVTTPIVPERICPHIFNSLNRNVINRLRVDMQVGVGTVSYPNPMLNLQISRDGGNTYGPTYSAPIGSASAFQQMVYFNRLGYARDLVIRAFGDGSHVPYNFVGAYLDMQECLS